MQDRVAAYPGRVQLTPVSGQTNVYDLARADDPIQAGTPINKATLLTDAAAAAVEAAAGENSPPSLPSQALAMLAAAISDLNGKAVQMETGGYTGTGTYGSANPCTLTFSFQPSIVIIAQMVDTDAETHNVPLIYKWGDATSWSSANGHGYSPSFTDIATGMAFGRSGIRAPVDNSGDGGFGGAGGAGAVWTCEYLRDVWGHITGPLQITHMEPAQAGALGVAGGSGCVIISWEV